MIRRLFPIFAVIGLWVIWSGRWLILTAVVIAASLAAGVAGQSWYFHRLSQEEAAARLADSDATRRASSKISAASAQASRQYRVEVDGGTSTATARPSSRARSSSAADARQ